MRTEAKLYEPGGSCYKTFDGCTFPKRYIYLVAVLGLQTNMVCVLVKRKCAFSDHVMIKLESLILAQNERWRQA